MLPHHQKHVTVKTDPSSSFILELALNLRAFHVVVGEIAAALLDISSSRTNNTKE